MPDKDKNPNELIQMTHDGKNFSQTTRKALDDVWSKKGWKEAKPEDVEKAEIAAAAEAADVPVKP